MLYGKMIVNDSDKVQKQVPIVDSVARPIESGPRIRTPLTQLWWLTGLCLALAIGLGSWSWFRRGIQIHVQFRDGHGLRAENRLMHRGIEVGVIQSVQLSMPTLRSIHAPAHSQDGNRKPTRGADEDVHGFGGDGRHDRGDIFRCP